MNVVAIGQNIFTQRCLDGFREAGWNITGIVTSEEKRADSVDMHGYLKNHPGATLLTVDSVNNPVFQTAIASIKPDYLFVSWHEILSKEILEIPRYFAIGSHPTPLPLGAGRHPLHWLVAMGHRASEVSFFRLTEKVDSGPVLYRQHFPVMSTMWQTQNEMHEAAQSGAQNLAIRLTINPAKNPGVSSQNGRTKWRAHTKWRARTEADITIDPRMSMDAIARLVNSYAPPFPGAILRANGTAMRVTAVVNSMALDSEWEQTGKILARDKQSLLLKVDDGAIVLVGEVPDEFRKLTHILPLGA